MAHVNSKHGKNKKSKKKKIKNTKKKKCVGRTNLFYLLCPISNTMPQFEQSSFHPQQFSVITSCYRPPATTISVFSYTSTAPVKKNRSSNRLATPLREARRGFGPSTHYRNQERVGYRHLLRCVIEGWVVPH